jgi:hypothetical protein
MVQGHNYYGRFSYPTIKDLAVGIASLTLSGSLGTIAVTAGPLSTEDEALIARICRTTMQITPDDVRFDDCTSALQVSLSDLRSSVSMERAYRFSRAQCAKRGLKEGSSDYALCVLEGRDQAAMVGDSRSAREKD